MNKQLKLFLAAFGVSFAGSLPPGTLNVSVAGLAANSSIVNATSFALGAVLIEVLLVRLALVALNKMKWYKKYAQRFRLFSTFLLVLFGCFSIAAGIQMRSFNVSVPVVNNWPFMAGVVLSLFNPLHLPFWLGWSAVFKAKNLLKDDNGLYNIYVLAIGLGTMLAFASYALGGKTLVHAISDRQYLLNWAVGIVLISIAVADVARMIKRKITVAV